MATCPRSRSLRGPGPSYDQLQDPGPRPEGDPQPAPRGRRAPGLRLGREEPRARDLESGGPESPGSEPPSGIGDDAQRLVETPARQRRSLRLYKQVDRALRRRWQSFVAGLPGVTPSRSPPTLDTAG
ncbi:uncharacterized protein C11orf86 homolog isoform X2 [Ornithorhynchus anatinus]|uniref:uncharacterized protein C11orf86 homolog isoform X2 n=1 Tax=Ornithorhynchus anatinus TaxID=9258 RepID=UPI0010A7FFC9|nr:uncharacterized protein C11orf86 homolog isoform X2 [Ornithorhynchus anatinus]